MVAFFRFFARWPYFARTGVASTDAFRPLFVGWGYEMRRDGVAAEVAYPDADAVESRTCVPLRRDAPYGSVLQSAR